jgi:hypothetical protein
MSRRKAGNGSGRNQIRIQPAHDDRSSMRTFPR